MKHYGSSTLAAENPALIPVDGTMLQEEVLLIAEKLGIDGFTASNGWLQAALQPLENGHCGRGRGCE